MSDPVTTAEVEDVLSSIRRLVSEEKRPQQAAETPQQSERLVLTPALRVQEDQSAKEGVATDIKVPFRSDRGDDATPVENAALTTPDVADNVHSAPFDLSAHAEQTKSSDTLNLTSADLANDYSHDPYKFDENQTEKPGETAVTLPPLTLQPEARSDAEWAADAIAEAEAMAESVKGSEPTEDSIADEIATDNADEIVAETTTTAATKAATLSAKIEALESAIGGIEDDFEPDEVSDDAYSGTHAPALAWEDDLEDADLEDEDLDDVPMPVTKDVLAAVIADDTIDDMSAEVEDISPEIATKIADDTVRELHQPTKEAIFAAAATRALADMEGADSADFEVDNETKFLDEDALRDMVGDIVRSELQGALGERITRNVRKLVRREIHRALTTQDLD